MSSHAETMQALQAAAAKLQDAAAAVRSAGDAAGEALNFINQAAGETSAGGAALAATQQLQADCQSVAQTAEQAGGTVESLIARFQ